MPVEGNVNVPLLSVIALPKLPYPAVSLTSQLEAIGSASPVNDVVNLHCEPAVRPPPLTNPLVKAVPPLATGSVPVT